MQTKNINVDQLPTPEDFLEVHAYLLLNSLPETESIKTIVNKLSPWLYLTLSHYTASPKCDKYPEINWAIWCAKFI